jgi:hypothetical protein
MWAASGRARCISDNRGEHPALADLPGRTQQRLGIQFPSLYVTSMSGEPSNFDARAMARWLASRGRPRARWQPPGPRPTLAELQRSHCWTWVYCEKCLHHAPMALVPLIIRWGADTSSDRLRQRARCTKCGHKGASSQNPGWAGTHIGFQPFPASVESSSRPLAPAQMRSAISPRPVRSGSDHWRETPSRADEGFNARGAAEY